jgi:hypothetical protein
MQYIDQYSDSLKEKQGIRCSSYGLDYAGKDKVYDGKIHKVALGYRIEKNLKFVEARKLFYEAVDGLLAHLNKNEKIRDYFFHFPLTYKDLEFHFSFDYESKGYLKKDEVDSIHINENRITYFIVDKEEPPKTTNDSETPNEIISSFFTTHRSITNKLPEKQ